MNQHPLHLKAASLAAKYRSLEIEWISTLQEIERGKWFLKWGYPSLFKYCVSGLALSENVAYMLIGVSRKCSAIPSLSKAVKSGELNAWSAKRILPVVNTENANLWIDRAKNLSQRELEQAVASVCPEKVSERVKPVSGNRHMMLVGVSNELLAKLERVGELLAQRTRKVCSLEEKLEAMAECFLAKFDPVRKADRILLSKASFCRQASAKIAAASQSSSKHSEAKKSELKKSEPKQSVSKPFISKQTLSQQLTSKATSGTPVTVVLASGQVPTRRTPVPASLLHAVRARDRGACRFRLPDGSRCGARHWLDVHHIIPVSAGGTNCLENLITLCSAHHRALHLRGASSIKPAIRQTIFGRGNATSPSQFCNDSRSHLSQVPPNNYRSTS